MPILYLIISVLMLVSVVPMYFYSRFMVTMNRDRLKDERTHPAEYDHASAVGRNHATTGEPGFDIGKHVVGDRRD